MTYFYHLDWYEISSEHKQNLSNHLPVFFEFSAQFTHTSFIYIAKHIDTLINESNRCAHKKLVQSLSEYSTLDWVTNDLLYIFFFFADFFFSKKFFPFFCYKTVTFTSHLRNCYHFELSVLVKHSLILYYYLRLLLHRA